MYLPGMMVPGKGFSLALQRSHALDINPMYIPESVTIARKERGGPGLCCVPMTRDESGSDLGSVDSFVIRRRMFAGKPGTLENSEELT